MRQILILTGERDEKIAILNLSPTHTYSVIFTPGEKVQNTEERYGRLVISYAHATKGFELKFIDMEDMKCFEENLVEYLMNGAKPIEIEGSKAEIRYWMEFEVQEINYA